jgi:general secretion pathway protein M
MRAMLGWPPEKRRQAAIAFLVAALLIAGAIVALPLWLAHRHYDDALEDMGRRLERYERMMAARPMLEEKLEAVRAMNSKRFFLKASAASLSAAEVQERVRQLVEGGGGRLISVQVGQPREDGRFRQVSVTVQLNANIMALRRILLAAETAEPYMFVDALTVRSQVPPGYKGMPGLEPEMFVQLDISGFTIVN